MATRLFVAGVIVLFFGVQLRAIESFVLCEKATEIVNRRIPDKSNPADLFSASSYDGGTGYGDLGSWSKPPKRTITPPRWLGWSFLSIGAVLALSWPCFR